MWGGRLGSVLKAFIPKASPFCDHQVRGLGDCVNREGVIRGSLLHPLPPSPSPLTCGPHTSTPCTDDNQEPWSHEMGACSHRTLIPETPASSPGTHCRSWEETPKWVPGALCPMKCAGGRACWCTQVKHSQNRANPAPPRLRASTRNRRLPPPSPHCPVGQGSWGLECLLLQVTGRKWRPIMPLTMPRWLNFLCMETMPGWAHWDQWCPEDRLPGGPGLGQGCAASPCKHIRFFNGERTWIDLFVCLLQIRHKMVSEQVKRL